MSSTLQLSSDGIMVRKYMKIFCLNYTHCVERGRLALFDFCRTRLDQLI